MFYLVGYDLNQPPLENYTMLIYCFQG